MQRLGEKQLVLSRSLRQVAFSLRGLRRIVMLLQWRLRGARR